MKKDRHICLPVLRVYYLSPLHPDNQYLDDPKAKTNNICLNRLSRQHHPIAINYEEQYYPNKVDHVYMANL